MATLVIGLVIIKKKKSRRAVSYLKLQEKVTVQSENRPDLCGVSAFIAFQA